MSKFERINPQDLLQQDKAEIRDTGIKITSIVKLSLIDDYSQKQILEAYPQLEAEDIHQALGWYSHNMRYTLRVSIAELRTFCTPIKGYANLIRDLKKDGIAISEKELEEIWEVILSSAKYATSTMDTAVNNLKDLD